MFIALAFVAIFSSMIGSLLCIYNQAGDIESLGTHYHTAERTFRFRKVVEDN